MSEPDPGRAGSRYRDRLRSAPVEFERPVRRFSAKLVAFALPLIILVSSLGGIFAWRSYQDVKERERVTMTQLAAATTTAIDVFLEQRFALLETLAADPRFATARPAAIQPYLDRLGARERDFTGGLAWIDTRGVLRALSGATTGTLPVDLSDRDYVRSVLATGRPAAEAVLGRVTQAPLLVLAVATRGPDGEQTGVLTGSFQLATVGDVIPAAPAAGRELRVVDQSGRVLVGGPTDRLETVDPTSPFDRMLSERSGAVDGVTGLTGLPDRIIGFDTVPSVGWLVALSESRDEALSEARRSLTTEIAMLLSAAALAAVAVLLGARAIRRSQMEDERRRRSAERLRRTAASLISASTAEEVGATVCDAIRQELGSPWCAIVNRATAAWEKPRVVASSGEVPDAIPGLRWETQLGSPPELLAATVRGALDPDGLVPSATALVAGRIGTRPSDTRLVVSAGPEGRPLLDDESGALAAIVEDAEQAFERAALIERDRAARGRTELVARIAEAVDAADGVEGRMRRLVEAVVEAGFADFATVEGRDDSGHVEVLAAHHREGHLLEPLLALRAYRLPPGSPVGIHRLLDDGMPQLLASLEHQSLVTLDDVTVRLLAQLGFRSHIGVPVRSAAGVTAGLLLGRGEGRPRFDAQDLAVAIAIADRAGVALERSRLFAEQQHIALELQQSLLSEPADLDDRVRVVSRYRAAERELHVGGDWFDAFPLPEGRIGLAVGDVVGHGLAAAAAMGKLASALRAIAVNEAEPDEAIRRLELFAAQTPGARLATLAYAILDPATGRLRYSVAGHPPPMILGADGHVELLWDGRGGPLALAPGEARPRAERVMDRGAILLLYSDGLFERRGEIVDDSLERLAGVAGRRAGDDLDQMADGILTDLLEGRPRSDDVVVLALRLDHVGRRMRAVYPARPDQLATMRRDARAWLAGAALGESGRREDALLALGEAASNAVEHAYPAGSGTVTVELAEDDQGIVMTIGDAGTWRDPPAPGPRGRGLDIMRRLVDDLTVDAGPSGTAITLAMRRRAEVPGR